MVNMTRYFLIFCFVSMMSSVGTLHTDTSSLQSSYLESNYNEETLSNEDFEGDPPNSSSPEVLTEDNKFSQDDSEKAKGGFKESTNAIQVDASGFSEKDGDFVVDIDLEDMDDKDKVEHYRLRVGDVLLLAIYGEPDTYESVSVDPSGNISYLFAHDVKAYGKTVKELREDLKTALENYYKYPIILITPQQFVAQYYTILGEVNSPGVREIRGNTTLIKAFADAGGFATRIYRDQTMYTVDFDRCFLARKGKCLLKIHFEELVNGDFSQNVTLEPEDFIYIASNDKQRVFILGEVARPGTYDFFGSMSLVEAISLAGGLRADASSRVSVVRGAIAHPTQYYIDANLIMRGRARDFSLKPSDIVYIPPRKFTNLRLFLQSAIRGFVGNVSSQAGNNAFIQTTPAAAGERATDSTLNFGPATQPTVIVP